MQLSKRTGSDEQDCLTLKQHKGIMISMKMLLTDKKTKEATIFAADDFPMFFENKIDDIHHNTEDASKQNYSPSYRPQVKDF